MSSAGSAFLPDHRQMDEPEKKYKLEDNQQEAESETVDDLVTQSVNDESPESVKETNDGDESTPDQKKSTQLGLVSEKLEEEVEVAALDSVIEPEPFVSLSEEFNQTRKDPPVQDTLLANNKIEQSLDDESNGVSLPAVVVVDSVSKEIDSLSGQNGVSPIVSNGIEQALDEINGASSFAMDSVSKGTEEKTMLPASDENSNPGESSAAAVDLVVSKENVANVSRSADVPLVVDPDNDNVSELPESTENQPFIAVIPRPVQRTSWWGCCGLFGVVRRSI